MVSNPNIELGLLPVRSTQNCPVVWRWKYLALKYPGTGVGIQTGASLNGLSAMGFVRVRAKLAN